MRNAIFVDFEERNTASVDVWVIFGSFSKEERHDLAKHRASSVYIYIYIYIHTRAEASLKVAEKGGEGGEERRGVGR